MWVWLNHMAEQEDKAKNQFGQLNIQQKMGLGIGVAALFALIAGAWMWGQTPDYRLLYSNLSDRDGGAIIESLQQMNIPYRFAEGGGALMVASNKVHEARLKLASQGLPKGGNVGFELMENQKFGITQFAEQVNYQRALEGELARSVQSIGAVAAARVHLAIPKPSVFVKEKQKPSASVVISLQGGRMLDSSQVNAIIHLISGSVPELSARNVTVVDQNGALLSPDHDGVGSEGLDANQLKYVQQVEQSYIKRIEALLVPMLGANNVRAQVAANIDFSRTEQTAETYKPNKDPSGSAIRSQQSSEVLNGAGLNASGVPGALTNQPPVPAVAPIVAASNAVGSAAGNLASLQKESTVNYEVDRTISHIVLPVGSIKRLSVAVVVNGNRRAPDGKGNSIDKPLSDAEKELINSLAKDAVGFDPARGDSLNVQVASFAEQKEVIEEIPFWKQLGVIELAKELFKYLVIAAVIFFVASRVIRPAFNTLFTPPAVDMESASETAQESKSAPQAELTSSIPSYEQNLKTAREIAQQEPKIAAGVIKEWVNSNG